MPDINIKNTFTPPLTIWTHSHSFTSPLLYPSVSTVLIRQSVINRFLISIFIFHIFVMQLIEINIETVGIFDSQLRQCVLFDTADQQNISVVRILNHISTNLGRFQNPFLSKSHFHPRQTFVKQIFCLQRHLSGLGTFLRGCCYQAPLELPTVNCKRLHPAFQQIAIAVTMR